MIPHGRTPASRDDLSGARSEMVRAQLLERGIEDESVLAAMEKVPRHRFLDPALRSRAYGDHALPIGSGQTISQPYMVALMTACLRLKGGEKILEIGTGSGYQAAILAEFTPRVFTIERHAVLARSAAAVLAVPIDYAENMKLTKRLGDLQFSI